MSGYLDDPDETARSLHEGWYSTGDIGFLWEGELYVSGREKDMVIVAGNNIYPEYVEETLAGVAGLHPGRVVVFGVFNDLEGTEELVVLGEVSPSDPGEPAHTARISREIRRLVWETYAVAVRDIRLLPRRTLQKSTSGKLSRGLNRRMYLEKLVTQSGAV
jgi:acyl-CoA synthetase (AMP-forming)/AMP-acid ligase II